MDSPSGLTRTLILLKVIYAVRVVMTLPAEERGMSNNHLRNNTAVFQRISRNVLSRYGEQAISDALDFVK